MQYGRRARLSGGDESGAVAVVAETRRMEVDGQVEREVQDVRSSGIGSAGLLGVLVASCMACAGLVFLWPRRLRLAGCTGRTVWAGKISSASLEGGGGSDLSTTGASVDNPLGVTIDSAAGLIFWANASDNKISYANLTSTAAAAAT